ncbi:MAG: OmpA family protein [Acetobacteraceae bacterium]|nr:OmpA family protein [Acetobacteraceae bacterium]
MRKAVWTTLVGAGVTLAAAAPAAAQVSGVYVGAGAGVQFLTETINRRNPSGQFIGQGRGLEARFSPGVIVNATLGYGLGGGFRAEIEGFYRSNSVNQARLWGNGSFTNGSTAEGGRFQAYGAMVNALYDFDLSPLGSGWRWFQPYVGVGIGYAYLDLQNLQFRTLQNQFVTTVSGTSSAFAYQGIIGAAFPLDGVAPGLALTAEYRYFGTTTPALRAVTQIVPTQNQNQNQRPFTLDTSKASPGYGAHSLLIGLRYQIDAPRPVSPAAMQPLGFTPPVFRQQQFAPQGRSYAVLFALNSASLDASARGTIAEAVAAARSFGSTSLDVVGQADATGNAAANRSLAQRRAQAVVAELTRQGIPRNALRISTAASGMAGDASARRVDITLN